MDGGAQFVFVTNAKRKIVSGNIGTCEVDVRDAQYSYGELGLIHFKLNDAFTKLQTPRTYNCRPYYQSTDTSIIVANPAADEIPILFSNDCFVSPANKIGYFLAPFRENEIARIDGKTLDAALMKSIILRLPSEHHELIQWWKSLQCFDTLYDGDLSKIPIEIVRREYPAEQMKRYQQHLQKLNDMPKHDPI